jgi:hypothetical protein
MSKGILACALLLWGGMAGAQSSDYIRYYPPAGLSTMTGTATSTTSTVPILGPAGAVNAPSFSYSGATNIGMYFMDTATIAFSINSAVAAFKGNGLFFGSNTGINWTSASANPNGSIDLAVWRDAAAGTLAQRNGTNAQTLRVYNSYTTAGSNYGRFAINASATGTDLVGEGAGATAATGALRSIQGSVAKTLTDAAAAVSFVRIPVATNASIGGEVIWNAMSTDATSPLTQTGSTYFAGVNTAGTVTCTVGASGTPITAYSRVNTLACTVSTVTATTNCDLQVTCTDNLAGDQTPIFNWRLDMPILGAVVPQ